MLGRPAEGWPRKIRKIVLDSAGVKGFDHRPGAKLRGGGLRENPPGTESQDRDRNRPIVMSSPTCSIRRSSSTSPSIAQKFGDTSVIPTRPFFYGLQIGEEITDRGRAGQVADRQLPHRQRRSRRRHPHGVLRTQRSAAVGASRRSFGRGRSAHASQGRARQSASRGRIHAGQSDAGSK